MKSIVALAFFASAAVAQTPTGSIQIAFDAIDRGRYLEATDGLAAAMLDEKGVVRDQSAFQMWRQFSPFITNELDLAALDRMDGGNSAPADPERIARISTAHPGDALSEIVRRARATSIVILNEAHHSPRDRAFGLEVARALRPLGYSVLAGEGFQNDESSASSTCGWS